MDALSFGDFILHNEIRFKCKKMFGGHSEYTSALRILDKDVTATS